MWRLTACLFLMLLLNGPNPQCEFITQRIVHCLQVLCRHVCFAALQFVTTPSDMIIAPGSEHILRCTVTPPTTNLIVWYQDDVEVNLSGGRVTTRHGGTELVITGVQRSDSGRYTCEASSSEGSLRSLGATIQVACK